MAYQYSWNAPPVASFIKRAVFVAANGPCTSGCWLPLAKTHTLWFATASHSRNPAKHVSVGKWSIHCKLITSIFYLPKFLLVPQFRVQTSKKSAKFVFLFLTAFIFLNFSGLVQAKFASSGFTPPNLKNEVVSVFFLPFRFSQCLLGFHGVGHD